MYVQAKKLTIELAINSTHPLYWLVKALQNKYDLDTVNDVLMAAIVVTANEARDIVEDGHIDRHGIQAIMSRFKKRETDYLYCGVRCNNPEKHINYYKHGTD